MRKRRITKTSKLEEKLDGIITLLKATPGLLNANNPPDTSRPSSQDDVYDSTTASSVGNEDNIHNRPPPNSEHISASNSNPAASSSSSSSLGPMAPNLELTLLYSVLQPSPEDAELYLNKFRSDFTKCLPFIVIPPSMTSYKLRQERPILWTCIMTVASSNSTQQITLSREVGVTIGRETFVHGTRSMDLLLRVLVYATW